MDSSEKAFRVIYEASERAYSRARHSLERFVQFTGILMGFASAILAICVSLIDYGKLAIPDWGAWLELSGVTLILLGVLLLCRVILKAQPKLRFNLSKYLAEPENIRQEDILKSMSVTYVALEAECARLDSELVKSTLAVMLVFGAGFGVFIIACVICKGGFLRF